MLDSIKRLFAARPGARDLEDVIDWARRRNHVFKRARGDDGFVIEGELEGRAWRLEWGPPQRAYIEGRELRLRMEIGLSAEAQMLLLSRGLMDTLERRTFEEFTDTLQTTVGTETPEEMRWLVMFPKVDLSDFGTLREHFGAVASVPATARAWLDGLLAGLCEEAVTAPAGLLRGAPPFVLMTLRGRAYLRMRLDVPRSEDISTALALFETAVTRAAQAVAGRPVGARGGRESRLGRPSR